MDREVLMEVVVALAAFFLSLIWLFVCFVYTPTMIALGFTSLLILLAGGKNFDFEDERLLVLLLATFLLFYASVASEIYNRFSGWQEKQVITDLVRKILRLDFQRKGGEDVERRY